MPSRTTNYNLYKPDLGQTDPEWGTGLNQNFDTIDSELKNAEDHRNLTPSSSIKPHNISEVDETDTDVTKNKVVSNSLAKGWEDHKNSVIGSSTPHNIDQVNEADTDTTKNRLVSNALAKGWEDHKNTTSGNPHGVDFVELDDAPSDYTDQAGKAVVVKSTEDGVEFSNPAPAAHGPSHELNGSDQIDVRGLQGGWLTADTEANRPCLLYTSPSPRDRG